MHGAMEAAVVRKFHEPLAIQETPNSHTRSRRGPGEDHAQSSGSRFPDLPGFGHIAIQYARAMGLHLAALDVGRARLTPCAPR
jgi:hypothetical protein